MRAWWADRTAREQIMLSAMAVLCLCVAVYFFAILPMKSYRDSARASFYAAQNVFDEVSSAAAQLEQIAVSPRRGPEPNGEPVRIFASATAQQLGLGITRIQPVNETDVAFWFDAVAVRDLFNWIVTLEAEAGVSFPRIEVLKHLDADAVQAQVILRSAP